MVLILMLVACGPKKATVVQAAAPDTSANLEMPLDPGVRSGTLDNGLTWFIETNATPEARVVFRLVVRVGSVLEDDDQLGLAHFVEHMAFNGTEHFPGGELVTYLEGIGSRFGAHLNAHTSFDETVYKLEVPSDDPALLDKTLQVLADWAGGVSFDPTEIEKERGVVLEEWRLHQGAGGRISDQLIPLTFHDSLYKDRLPIGTKESLEGFDPDALRRFYDDWYRPELMGLVVVGDIDPDAMQAAIEQRFSTLSNPEPARPRVSVEIPRHDSTLIGIFPDPEMPQTSVTILAKVDDVEGNTHQDYRDFLIENLVLAMVNERLGDLANSEDPPFLGSSAGAQRMSPTEKAFILAMIVRENTVSVGLDAVATEIARIKMHGFTEAELHRARVSQMRVMENYASEELSTHSAIHAEEIVRHYTTGEPMPGISYEFLLSQTYLPLITADEVREFLDGWMPEHSRVVAVVMPEKEGLEPPTEDALRAVLEAVKTKDIPAPFEDEATRPLLSALPVPGAVTSESQLDDGGVVEWVLSNGARVLLKPTPFKQDEVLLAATSPGGMSMAHEDELVPAATAISTIMRSGLGEHDPVQIGKILAGKSASVYPVIGAESEGVSAIASPTDLETMFQLVHLAFTAPRLSPKGQALDRESRVAQLQNRLSDPHAVFADAWTQLMWQGHPRFRPWTVDTLSAMDIDASRGFYTERFADADDFTFAIVGAFTLDGIRPLVERYLASLPRVDGQETALDVGARRVKGQQAEVVRAGIAPQSTVRVVYHGPWEPNMNNEYTLAMLGEILTVRLREELREELGGTYGVTARGSVSNGVVPGYTLNISFECDPARAQELTEAAMAIVDDVRAQPVSPHLVAQVQEQSRRGHEVSLTDNRTWLAALISVARHGHELREVLDIFGRADALTVGAVHDMAKRALRDDRRVTMTLLPGSE